MGALSGCSSDDDDDSPATPTPDPTPTPTPAPDLTQQLRANVKTVVVIFAENRSFNNLFANFPGVEKPLSALTAADYAQNDRDGTPLSVLPPVWNGMVPTSQQANHITYQVDQAAPYMNNLPNAPFALLGPQGEPLPQGVVTRDLWHVFYQNQMQINGGKNDRFVAWADSGALVMGHYSDSAYNLRLWKLAQEFVLCDNFFQGAFGGSFLNHQYLVAGPRTTAKRRSRRSAPAAQTRIARQRADRHSAIRRQRADAGRLRREYHGPALLAFVQPRRHRPDAG
ncbi:hypothetical protein G6F22_015491 [Rhizopus arrhizus]|nr:hypothetical protein G6F22_015491 [Rhizopus arrhizus]